MSYKLVTISGNHIRFLGDSFTIWPSTGVTSGERAWWIRLGQRYHIQPRSHGQGSTGFFTGINNCYNSFDTPSPDSLALLLGYNDVKVFLLDPEGIEHGKSGIRAILANHFLAAAVAANNASVTKTGTWTNPSLSSSKSGKLSGECRQSSTSGDKISYIFSGDNVVIGIRNSDGVAATYGSVSITVDSISQGTYSANNKAYNVTTSGGFIWNAIVLRGFGAGSHTVVIELAESNIVIVDYFGTLRDPSLCHPVIIGDIQHENTTSATARNAAADNLSAEIKTMVATDFPEYVDKIAYAPTNVYYDASDPTQISGDNVHPQEKGYKRIYRAFERVIIQ